MLLKFLVHRSFLASTRDNEFFGNGLKLNTVFLVTAVGICSKIKPWNKNSNNYLENWMLGLVGLSQIGTWKTNFCRFVCAD